MRKQSAIMTPLQVETVGELLRILRARRGLEQIRLARACGWKDASAVSRMEKDRVDPTRKTLVKLADNLADPATTGTSAELRAAFFLAAGLLPTANEVADLKPRMPEIEDLPHPASVMDFGWYLWRANERLRRGFGLPVRHTGRNYLEMFFEDHGSIRAHLGSLWPELAPILVGQFREETARRTGQRWFRRLLDRLREMPDFNAVWNNHSAADHDAFGWSHTSIRGGMVGAVRTPLTADPRLIVGHILPEDPGGRDQMLKYGALAP